MPEAICCYLQTCIVVLLMLAIKYIMYTNFVHIALTNSELY